ncbi:hypothetical protein DAEQUDRAFT_262976 [Daedalea quercina L-15889]|uniref:Uncharacterized protein n=1 Tax=Daedalea quercina L-15889 TaxID=1314783 RepID=A0A165QF62_9APHY|nr:hypothetical protein DAEQUDRAFT_262976 [Daedalea quercina L-15889]
MSTYRLLCNRLPFNEARCVTDIFTQMYCSFLGILENSHRRKGVGSILGDDFACAYRGVSFPLLLSDNDVVRTLHDSLTRVCYASDVRRISELWSHYYYCGFHQLEPPDDSKRWLCRSGARVPAAVEYRLLTFKSLTVEPLKEFVTEYTSVTGPNTSTTHVHCLEATL